MAAFCAKVKWHEALGRSDDELRLESQYNYKQNDQEIIIISNHKYQSYLKATEICLS